MSFFQTVVMFFAATLCVVSAYSRFLPHKTSFWKGLLYPALAFSILVLIFWTLVQMLFGFPKFDNVFPITATTLGILFAVGTKGAYSTLKNRKAGRR